METDPLKTPPAGVKYRREAGPFRVEISVAGEMLCLALVDRHSGTTVRTFLDPVGARWTAGGLRVLADQIEGRGAPSSGLEEIGGSEL